MTPMADRDLLDERLEQARREVASAAFDLSDPLPPERRRVILDAFRGLIEGMYVHLPQKRASYGFDPSQRLRLLGERAAELRDDVFHRELAQIVTDLCDAHTRYLGPRAHGDQAMFLPILVERYTDEGGTVHFVASKVRGLSPAEKRRFTTAGFEDGVELTHWNAVPIERAVDLYAERETGGRPDARVARALESLTMRPLRFALPPDEEWVDVGFLTKRRAAREIRLEWQRVSLSAEPAAAPTPSSMALAYDPIADASREVKKMLFARPVWESEQRAARGQPMQTVEECLGDGWAADRSGWLAGRFAANVAARVVTHRGREYGYLRLYSFQLRDDQAFISEVIEMLGQLPANGLIIDLRSNPGGLVWAAEGLLQLFTPNHIRPTRFTMLATDLTRAMAASRQNRHLAPWAESLDDAVTTGVSHSRSVPLTPLPRCNNIGQRYGGPVVAIVDANTYSAGDLFAAGFVDNDIGKLICTDAATGGGGANVWTLGHAARALAGTDHRLPDFGDVSFTMSFRRAERIGESGNDIEDTGITGSFRHPLTHRDLTDKNRDLIDYASGLLATETVTAMAVEVSSDSITVRTDGIDRVVLTVDGTPHLSAAVERGAVEFPVEPTWNQRMVEVVGFRGAEVRQRRRIAEADI
jgi:hypothetical protein